MWTVVTSQKAVWSEVCPCTYGNVQARWPLPAAGWPPLRTASFGSWLWNTTHKCINSTITQFTLCLSLYHLRLQSILLKSHFYYNRAEKHSLFLKDRIWIKKSKMIQLLMHWSHSSKQFSLSSNELYCARISVIYIFLNDCTHSKESTPPANICKWLRVVMDVVRWRLAWSNCFMSLVISLTCGRKKKQMENDSRAANGCTLNIEQTNYHLDNENYTLAAIGGNINNLR